jgi:hypothetical protein
MIINLSPVRSDEELAVVKQGDILIINGEAFDFSPMADGDTLPMDAIASPWFAGPVDRVGSELQFTLLLPLPVNYSPEQAYPAALKDVPDGEIRLPQPLPVSRDQAEIVQGDQ